MNGRSSIKNRRKTSWVVFASLVLATTGCIEEKRIPEERHDDVLPSSDEVETPVTFCESELETLSILDGLWEEVEKDRSILAVQNFFEPIRFCEQNAEPMDVRFILRDERGDPIAIPQGDHSSYYIGVNIYDRTFEIESDDIDFVREFLRE